MRTTTDILTTYLGDMLAAQNHMLKLVEQQMADPQVTTHTPVYDFLAELRPVLSRHTGDLEQRLIALGGSVTADVKGVLTIATGLAAGLFGRMRAHIASKFVRDDYVLLSACSIGYEMLHATALALRDMQTANMALDHFKTLTPMIVRLSDIVPGIVVQELTHDVSGVDAGAVLIAKENTRHAWSGDHVHHNA